MKRIDSRRIATALGAIILLAGLAMLAVGLFSYVGQGDSGASTSTTLSRDSIANDTIRVRLREEASTAPTPTEAPTPTPTPPLARDVPYRMIIESIGVDAPVFTFGLDEEGVPLVPLNGEDVAWYDFSALPGTGSNAVFAGHVDWTDGRAVFADLHKLRAGDTVKLRSDDGTELVYAVSANFLVDATDPEALQVMKATPTDTITLITCGGSWIPDPSEQFGGSYTDRLVVQASLVSINTVAVAETSAGES